MVTTEAKIVQGPDLENDIFPTTNSPEEFAEILFPNQNWGGIYDNDPVLRKRIAALRRMTDLTVVEASYLIFYVYWLDDPEKTGGIEELLGTGINRKKAIFWVIDNEERYISYEKCLKEDPSESKVVNIKKPQLPKTRHKETSVTVSKNGPRPHMSKEFKDKLDENVLLLSKEHNAPDMAKILGVDQKQVYYSLQRLKNEGKTPKVGMTDKELIYFRDLVEKLRGNDVPNQEIFDQILSICYKNDPDRMIVIIEMTKLMNMRRPSVYKFYHKSTLTEKPAINTPERSKIYIESDPFLPQS